MACCTAQQPMLADLMVYLADQTKKHHARYLCECVMSSVRDLYHHKKLKNVLQRSLR